MHLRVGDLLSHWGAKGWGLILEIREPIPVQRYELPIDMTSRYVDVMPLGDPSGVYMCGSFELEVVNETW
jgi:hypothetical protein